jgi:hypothetical protein
MMAEPFTVGCVISCMIGCLLCVCGCWSTAAKGPHHEYCTNNELVIHYKTAMHACMHMQVWGPLGRTPINCAPLCRTTTATEQTCVVTTCCSCCLEAQHLQGPLGRTPGWQHLVQHMMPSSEHTHTHHHHHALAFLRQHPLVVGWRGGISGSFY